MGGGWLEPEAVVVLEETAGADVVAPPGLQILDRRTYGDTQVLFLQLRL
jgi:16S rRNA (guanine966-N2)-methyltransferase